MHLPPMLSAAVLNRLVLPSDRMIAETAAALIAAVNRPH